MMAASAREFILRCGKGPRKTSPELKNFRPVNCKPTEGVAGQVDAYYAPFSVSEQKPKIKIGDLALGVALWERGAGCAAMPATWPRRIADAVALLRAGLHDAVAPYSFARCGFAQGLKPADGVSLAGFSAPWWRTDRLPLS